MAKGSSKGDSGKRTKAAGPKFFKKRSALVPPEFHYEGELGPCHWGEIPAYPLCKIGLEQSPVEIPTTGTPVTGPAVVLSSLKEMPYRVQRDAHGISVVPESETLLTSAAILELDSDRYVLEHIHFHTPSEHIWAGRTVTGPFEMEIHLVHYSARELQDELDTGVPRPIIPVVVALWVELGVLNIPLGKILDHMPTMAGNESIRLDLDITDWFQDRSYFHYFGSLTTPPCTEGVRFFVMRRPVAATLEQVGRFRTVLGMNARPIQALNGRVVYEFIESGSTPAPGPAA
jgi:carbonic anhydrase